MRAAIALALSFETWRTLVRDQGLSEAEAISVVVRLAGGSPAPDSTYKTRRSGRKARLPERTATGR